MSYGLPQNGPTHRHPDQWQSSGRSRFEANGPANGGISEKMSNMITGDRGNSLPMYKDKPYQYPGSQRRRPWFRRKKNAVLLLGTLAGLSWWFGILSPLSYVSSGAGSTTKSKMAASGGLFGGGRSDIDWDDRAERVKDAFKLSWAGYEQYAWGFDEFHPSAKTSKQMTPRGMGWIIIDALDTMMLMNLTTELAHARQWMHTNLTYDQNHDVSTFETTIRMLGGLLSAHYLSSAFPGVYAPVNDGLSDDMYVEKATDLADRLLGAYESGSGIPFASVNLHTMQGIPSGNDGGASSTAEATSVQLEMKYLAKLTGETHYWRKAEHVMEVVDNQNARDGLVPIFIHPDHGGFRGANVRLGSRGDSYYEYLIKQYLQTSQQESVYQAMWNESMAGIKKYLITYSSPSNFTILAERPSGLDNAISAKMDHLVCFLPGTVALATTGGLPLAQARQQSSWTEQRDEDLRIAEELMKTCWGMYKVTPTGLAPEIAHFNLHDPPLMYEDFPRAALPQSPVSFDPPNAPHAEHYVGQEDYIIKMSDSHNLQRPETVESLFYMWRITGDEKYRKWGWEMFQSFVKYTAVDDGTGFSSVSNVMSVPPSTRDNMESFWLAETLKYFYLLFSSNDILPLTDVVFNTEAHPFPRFQMGKLFSTGWQRRPRDSEGKLLPDTKLEPKSSTGDAANAATAGGNRIQTQVVAITKTMEMPPTVDRATLAQMTTATDGAADAASERTADARLEARHVGK